MSIVTVFDIVLLKTQSLPCCRNLISTYGTFRCFFLNDAHVPLDVRTVYGRIRRSHCTLRTILPVKRANQYRRSINMMMSVLVGEDVNQ